jgi:hypothetical protein
VSHKIKLLIELDCDEMAFSMDDQESVEWFLSEVLKNETEEGALYLHSNEIGDSVGRVRVLEVHGWPGASTETGSES